MSLPNLSSQISDRATSIDVSGIRKVFDLGATLSDPINLSIGQPDFPVPDSIKDAAKQAIDHNHNGYTLTQGVLPLIQRIAEHLKADLAWPDNVGERDSDTPIIVTSGTSGALYLMMQALLNPGDEIIIPDPYFVPYPSMAELAGARPVLCDTYPDFRMTADRIEPLITEHTKAVLLNSPSNPAGVVLTQHECKEVLELCRSKNVLLISDEIYDEFCFEDHREAFPTPADSQLPETRCPSPCREPGAHEDVLLIRGFGKTYGCTGWRLGYIAGPAPIVNAIRKLQQYTFVCPPAPLQHAMIAALDLDMTGLVAEYADRRDEVLQTLGQLGAELGEDHLAPTPGGAFYLFVKVPERLSMTGQQFFEHLVQENILTIPGNVFSSRDTHIRLSIAAPPEKLSSGIEQIAAAMRA
ncbi:MAG: pyridoxal phosphate-dependent aminotransferase [Planctomycetota bacterium]